MERKCIICGNLFQTKYAKSTLCSDACRDERQRQHSAKYVVKRREKDKQEEKQEKKQEKNYENKYCILCGKEYKPTSGRQKTCSKECGKIEKSIYQAEWYRAGKAEDEHYEKKPKAEGVHYEKKTQAETEKPKKPKKKDSLTADAVAAHKLGVSYGKYIAYYKRGGGR